MTKFSPLGYCAGIAGAKLLAKDQLTKVTTKRPTMFDVTKPYKTVDGCPAEAFRVSEPNSDDFIYIGYFEDRDGVRLAGWWDADGRSHSRPDSSLVNVEIRRTKRVWINVYENGDFTVHPSRKHADFNDELQTGGLGADIFAKRIACVESGITYAIGEGL